MQIKTPLASLAPSKLRFCVPKKSKPWFPSLRQKLAFCSEQKTSLAPFAPSKLGFLFQKTPLTSLAPSIAATSAIFAERPTLHCLLHIHGSCLLHMQHAMTTHTTLTHGGFLISKYTVVWGPRWYHIIYPAHGTIFKK